MPFLQRHRRFPQFDGVLDHLVRGNRHAFVVRMVGLIGLGPLGVELAVEARSQPLVTTRIAPSGDCDLRLTIQQVSAWSIAADR